MLPSHLGFVQFEHMDLSCCYINDNWTEWMPMIANRISLNDTFKSAMKDVAGHDRDASMLYKLKIERTIYRSCGKVSWGPRWRGRPNERSERGRSNTRRGPRGPSNTP